MRINVLKLGVGALAVLAAGPAVRAAAVVNLSVLINPGTQTWQAFADVEDPASAGLAGIQFDVTASSGITLGTTQGVSATSFNDLPVGTLATGPRSSVPAGFYVLSSAADISSTDLQFRGSQNGQYVPGQTSGHGNIVLGFGKPGQSGNIVGDSPTIIPWSFPAIIADGTYSGSSGSISIAGLAAATLLLPDQPTTTSGQLFATHFADTVNGGTAAVPEPGSLGMLALAGFACVRRRCSR
jgi:hypothetical protein